MNGCEMTKIVVFLIAPSLHINIAFRSDMVGERGIRSHMPLCADEHPQLQIHLFSAILIIWSEAQTGDAIQFHIAVC